MKETHESAMINTLEAKPELTSNPYGEGITQKGALISTLMFNGESFHLRPQDCYWDATRMCQAYGRRINNFLRSESTQRYLKALSKKLGIPIETTSTSLPTTPNSAMTEEQGTEGNCYQRALIYKSKGGDVEQSGTWVHQRVALKLAAWLNEDLEVWVYEVIEKLLTQGQVTLLDEIESLKKALHLKDEHLENVSNELALLEHSFDRHRYLVDELQRDMAWHRSNSWGGLDF